MNTLHFDYRQFENGTKVISIGKLPPEMVSFLIEKHPYFSSRLSSDTDILFWSDRMKHTELHKDDFMSDNEYYTCLENIPDIIQNPDYLSIHPKDNSISFIKDFSEHVSVAVKVSIDGKLSYRTMYPLMDAQLTDYIEKGRAWTWTNTQCDKKS